MLLIFTLYSFFIYDGAVRLCIAVTSGDFLSAYTTPIVDGHDRLNGKIYLIPTKNIETIAGSLYEFECSSFLGIKVCRYYGFG